MESVIFRFFSNLFRLIAVLAIGGTLTHALLDVQKLAASQRGLVSMRQINEQLVGQSRYIRPSIIINAKKIAFCAKRVGC